MQIDVHIDKVGGRDYQSFLDGEKLKHCWRANEEEGWADVHETDGNGDIILKSYELKTKRLHGKVELKKVR